MRKAEREGGAERPLWNVSSGQGQIGVIPRRVPEGQRKSRRRFDHSGALSVFVSLSLSLSLSHTLSPHFPPPPLRYFFLEGGSAARRNFLTPDSRPLSLEQERKEKKQGTGMVLGGCSKPSRHGARPWKGINPPGREKRLPSRPRKATDESAKRSFSPE
ncbi:hypothetical protein LX32DRAFT_185159 [Colletotrichum zoysiae]|uniref:Uncharacterized protein n=1 Tax=Colletotrichum zoysiae TaxID=1216348 RepID=A0AAD9H6E9_9PEZI|nr:hypothetical protein LX32DRAFT_185159 [Colletotrichum zoysiae]